MHRAVITAGVSYHLALTQPGEPLADFEPLDVHALQQIDLARHDLVLVLRSVDNEALWARRHQIAHFLDRGGVLVVFGEAWSNWFPGCRWEPECPEDLLPPVVTASPLLRGIAPEAIHWHAEGPRWCNHGHLVPPPGAEVLVANRRGDAWLYIDRSTTNGVILAATNLDLDTHTFHGRELARQLLQRLLAWADEEAARAPERRARATPKIAGLFSGVHFQRGFYEDAELRPSFAIVPAEELAGIDLSPFAAVWVPRESNQAALMRHRERLEAYLAQGGTLVTFDEVTQPWLRGGDWQQGTIDVHTLALAQHPLLDGLRLDQAPWHAHGAFAPPPGAATLIREPEGGAVLYLDEQTYAPGRVLAGTLDPDCHAGYGSEIPRPWLRTLLRWVLAGARQPVGSAAH
jgi:hypothetical protein